MKTHLSAVVVIPPEDLWEPIQAIRRLYDRQVARWMPHITLLYPFWSAGRFDEAVHFLMPACCSVEPFTVRLERLDRFSHGRGRYTMWLDPEPREDLARLQAALQLRVPDCDDASAFPGGFTPHLSVGQARGRAQLAGRMASIADRWRPAEFRVARVCLVRRDEDGPFSVERAIPLGQ